MSEKLLCRQVEKSGDIFGVNFYALMQDKIDRCNLWVQDCCKGQTVQISDSSAMKSQFKTHSLQRYFW